MLKGYNLKKIHIKGGILYIMCFRNGHSLNVH